MAPISLTLLIEKVIHGGSGLARTADGEIILVPATLPGELVEAILEGKRHGVTVASVRAVVEPSPDRCVPACHFFGKCGGCDWQFIEYSRQVALKKEIFLESMLRIGKLFSVPELDIIPSPQAGYRRRAQMKIDKSKKIGFFRSGSNDVVAVERCPLLSERLNALLHCCSRSPELLPDNIDNLMVIDGDAETASSPLLEGITLAATSVFCGNRIFEVGGSDFFQGNRFLLEPMAVWAASQCGSGATMVDCYGGIGFFATMLADSFDKGWLIETDLNMVRRAQANFRRNGCNNIHAVLAAAESIEKHLPCCPDVFIVDPPRPGLTRRVREAIARCAPDLLLYVSCNCATQARDCGFFVKKAGYAVKAAALFDCYPNTHHIESMILLQRH